MLDHQFYVTVISALLHSEPSGNRPLLVFVSTFHTEFSCTASRRLYLLIPAELARPRFERCSAVSPRSEDKAGWFRCRPKSRKCSVDNGLRDLFGVLLQFSNMPYDTLS